MPYPYCLLEDDKRHTRVTAIIMALAATLFLGSVGVLMHDHLSPLGQPTYHIPTDFEFSLFLYEAS